ncbi:hypothetical protein B9Z65_5385 [Elsinoe australis]|uniref:AA9 family lytic polysaccharide monooxygenase n=1 Tax=Elsinoe australis TaxID=40998 RepID=A0A2P7ZDW2_9PEZI|nr:hypothetical protein B9Z65_5385 [Elsinoe australis]
MLSIKKTLLLGVALAPSALAHTIFTNFYVNSVDQGNGTCVRMSKVDNAANSPIPDVEGTDMACGVSGLDSVARTCPIPDGATVTFKYDSIDRKPGKNWYIDPSHKGPCAIYAKKVDSPSADPTGDGWFKLWDQGFDGNKWCTENMIANNGLISVKLPSGLQRGYYLLRPELLALHAATDGDPQFYSGCAQVFLEGTGNLVPDTTVSIPGYVKKSDPALTWNIYYGTDPNDYVTPGGKVSGFVQNSNARVAQQSQTDGLKPEGCILENANWCGTEVPDYTDEDGCWKAVENCWDQNQACWDSVNNVIFDGCKISETRCKEITATCDNKVFPGPPNKGKVLTAPKSTITLGNVPAAGPVTGGSAAAPAPAPEPEQAAPVPSSAAPAPSSAAPAPSPAPEPEQPAPAPEAPAATPEQPKYEAPAPAPSTTEQPAAQTPTTPSPVEEQNNEDDNEESTSDDETEEPAKPAPEAPATTPAPEYNGDSPVVYITEYETVWETVTGPYPGRKARRHAHVRKHIGHRAFRK